MAELEKVRNPRDLLQRFMSVGHLPVKLEAAEAREDLITEELELTLGLSSNGCFGVDPMRAKKIKRTSSIPEFVMTTKQARDEDDASYLPTTTVMRCATTTTSLMRSCSLPTETEEEWRKRKELQTLRRMEARRKRSEKQRNSKATAVVRERNRASSEDNNGEENKRQEGNLNEISSLRKTTSLTRDCLGGLNLNSGLPPTPSSQGIGSSATSESESQLPPQGGREKSRREMMMKNSLEEMPCVSTKGEGPNGKRIQGFLYGYKKKGEEVRIVCVCHGTFLTPAEFVKHAGGNDVAHPLKHILVTPSF